MQKKHKIKGALSMHCWKEELMAVATSPLDSTLVRKVG